MLYPKSRQSDLEVNNLHCHQTETRLHSTHFPAWQSAGKLPRKLHKRVMLRLLQNDDVRWTTEQLNLQLSPKHGISPVWPHCVNARWNRCQEDLTAFPLENWRGYHWHALVLQSPCMWMKTIQRDLNPITSPWMKQLYVAQNCPLWRLVSTFGAMNSWWCRPEMNEWMNATKWSLWN